MNKESNKLDQIKGENPFKLPKGYMENLSMQVMDKIPERIEKPEEPISFIVKMRPFFYMAGMFAGMVFLLNLLIGDPTSNNETVLKDSLLVNVKTEYIDIQSIDEDEEYLEYVEEQYSGYLLTEEVALYE